MGFDFAAILLKSSRRSCTPARGQDADGRRDGFDQPGRRAEHHSEPLGVDIADADHRAVDGRGVSGSGGRGPANTSNWLTTTRRQVEQAARPGHGVGGGL